MLANQAGLLERGPLTCALDAEPALRQQLGLVFLPEDIQAPMSRSTMSCSPRWTPALCLTPLLLPLATSLCYLIINQSLSGFLPSSAEVTWRGGCTAGLRGSVSGSGAVDSAALLALPACLCSCLTPLCLTSASVATPQSLGTPKPSKKGPWAYHMDWCTPHPQREQAQHLWRWAQLLALFSLQHLPMHHCIPTGRPGKLGTT